MDIDNEFRLWEYRGEELAQPLAGQTWYVIADAAKKTDVLVPVPIPHSFIPEALKKAQADPNYFVFKAGTKVRLDVSGIADADQRSKVEGSLTARLKAKGFEPAQDGTIDLVASTQMGQLRKVGYRIIGSGGAVRYYKFQEYLSYLKLVYQGKQVWQTATVNFPPSFIDPPAGQTVESLIRKNERPNYTFFETAELPKLLPRPGIAVLGSSRVTPAGLR